jgi:hypothetical protein
VRALAAVGTSGIALACLAGPAAAAPAATVQGTGNAGSAKVVMDGTAGEIPALAPCDIAGTATNSTDGAAIDGVVSYDAATTSCTHDAAARTSAMSVKGGSFDFTALTRYGGPEISFDSYRTGCTGAKGSTGGSFHMTGQRGVELPDPLPANYTVTIPGANKTDPPMAKLVFGEVVPAPTQDGSTRLNTLHIKLFPEGGPSSGDLYMGSVHCTMT